MVVCKFFQQGYCRFGQSCRFEHIYGSKYSYNANQAQAQQQQQSAGVTDEQLVNQVQNDIQAMLKGNQWILTCFSPFKEKPLFPGIHDHSPEEIRLFIYEAKANNNLEQAISYINNLVKENRQKYERLLRPDPTITKILRSIYKGENVKSPFENPPSAFGNTENSSASSIFRNALQSPTITQTPTNSIFNQGQQNSNPKDIFASAAKQSVFTQNANTFNKPQESSAKSVFAQANQNVFQQNAQMPQNSFITCNQNAPAPTNLFSAANKSIFGQEDKQTSLFTQTQGNVFDKTELMHSVNVFQKNVVDDSVYSRIEELTPEELDAFKSDSFQLGFIPEIAPPKELCSSNRGF